jgi:cob(I)alamin adenosyltransferase
MMIYTKKGDCGMSDIISDNGLYKDDIVFGLLGDIDELTAHLAVARVHCDSCAGHLLEALQKELIYVSAHIAGGEPFDYKACVEKYEKYIDAAETEIDMPSSIIVFGDSESSAYIDLCRAVTRRCERLAVKFVREREFDLCLIKYFNRLSDYLFVLSLKYRGGK